MRQSNDVKTRGGEGKDLMLRTLYLPTLIATVVAVACAVALLAISQKAEATFPGKNGRIAYQDNSSLVIYTINPNGSAKTRVTGPCNYPSLPDYSPTGKKIVYTSCEGTLGKDLGISTINVGGGGKFRVTHVTHNNTDEEEPSYSPDGKKLVYTGWDGHDTEIYMINSDGTGKIQLTHNKTEDLGPSYSPDGKQIVFSSTVRTPLHPSEIYTMNVHGKNRVRLTHNNTEDYYPDYSPNGRRITFAGTGENGNHIYTISAHGGDKSKVTKGYYASYSPDGKKLAYSRGSDRNSAIYTINVGGGGESKVTEGGYPSWGPRP
jgi:TolB protein